MTALDAVSPQLASFSDDVLCRWSSR